MTLSDHSIANARQTDRGPYGLARLALWLWSRSYVGVPLDTPEHNLLYRVTCV